MVNVLLGHPEVDVNLGDAFGGTPFFAAVANGNVEVVRLFVNHPTIQLHPYTKDEWIQRAKRNARPLARMMKLAGPT